MALKAVHVSDVINPNQVPHSSSFLIVPNSVAPGVEKQGTRAGASSPIKIPKFMLIGHRGSGMNMLQSPDRRMNAIKENSIVSFNEAGKSNADFIEFDVQVGKHLFRRTRDGQILKWSVENDDVFCTLQEVFEKVEHSLGLDIELKFDDNVVYKEDELIHTVQVVMKVVTEYANDRSIIFSSFHPDAALLIRKLQYTYPVFFLTDGGLENHSDKRRNSLDEAMCLCLAGGLQGIVSEVRAVIRNPTMVEKIQQSTLSLITYGQLKHTPSFPKFSSLLLQGLSQYRPATHTQQCCRSCPCSTNSGCSRGDSRPCRRSGGFSFRFRKRENTS